MKLGHKSQIHYLTDLGTVSIYEVELEGRPVMRVTADLWDPNRAIMIAKADGTGVQKTEGQFLVKTEGQQLIEDADGNPAGVVPGTTRVSAISIYEFVLPRLPFLLARLLVPLA